jgi:hypothetical protein
VNEFEKWSVALAAVAALLSLWALYISKQSIKKADQAGAKAEEATRKAQLISEGTIELYLNEVISNARSRQSQVLIATLNDLPGSEKAKQIMGLLDESLEDFLNSIEEACSKYLDSKIDKGRFKAAYLYQIKNVMEKGSRSRTMVDERVNRFLSIETVYAEWFPENTPK